jgi:hypothetical protein
VIVAVGLTLVEPVADVEVNVPGVIAMRAAPVVDQLSVALEPGLIPVGFVANEVIVGIVAFPVGELDAPPQPVGPTQASRAEATKTSTSRERRNGTTPDILFSRQLVSQPGIVGIARTDDVRSLKHLLYLARGRDCSSPWL